MTVTLGKTFTLPATNGSIWAEIEIKKTLTGDWLSFLYKPTELQANVELADHSKKKCRIVPGMVRAGFLLSPYVADNASFLALARGDEPGLAGKALVAMTLFESDRSGLKCCYQPQIKIRFYRLDFPKQEIHFEAPKILPATGG
jgi:hypothetical protein